MKNVLLLFVITLFMGGCRKDDTLKTTNIINPPPPPNIVYKVGDVGPATGRIVHVPSTQEPYYVEAASEIIGVYSWGCGSTFINYTYGQSSTNGLQNTSDIVTQCNDVSFAAKACENYSDTVGNAIYNDWYLPSATELGWAFSAYSLNPTDWFWTSNQVSTVNAFALRTYGSDPSRITSKSNPYKVIAVRRF